MPLLIGALLTVFVAECHVAGVGYERGDDKFEGSQREDERQCDAQVSSEILQGQEEGGEG